MPAVGDIEAELKHMLGEGMRILRVLASLRKKRRMTIDVKIGM